MYIDVVRLLPYAGLATVLLLLATMAHRCRRARDHRRAADLAQLLHSVAAAIFFAGCFCLVFWLLPDTPSWLKLGLEAFISLLVSACCALMFWATTLILGVFTADWLAGGYPFPYPDHPSWRRAH